MKKMSFCFCFFSIFGEREKRERKIWVSLCVGVHISFLSSHKQPSNSNESIRAVTVTVTVTHTPLFVVMKFKAFLTENGVSLLEKRFIPALEKMGKACHLYLTRDHALFLHNLLNGDGIQSVAQFRKETLFDDYRISSQNDDRIAFSIDLSLLLRALRSSVAICSEYSAATATANDANRLQIKLVKKLPPNCTNPTPFLTFETRGFKSAVIQDIPISKPLSRAQVVELQNALDLAQDIPQTLIQVTP